MTTNYKENGRIMKTVINNENNPNGWEQENQAHNILQE